MSSGEAITLAVIFLTGVTAFLLYIFWDYPGRGKRKKKEKKLGYTKEELKMFEALSSDALFSLAKKYQEENSLHIYSMLQKLKEDLVYSASEDKELADASLAKYLDIVSILIERGAEYP